MSVDSSTVVKVEHLKRFPGIHIARDNQEQRDASAATKARDFRQWYALSQQYSHHNDATPELLHLLIREVIH